jgi:hypothetical protein
MGGRSLAVLDAYGGGLVSRDHARTYSVEGPILAVSAVWAAAASTAHAYLPRHVAAVIWDHLGEIELDAAVREGLTRAIAENRDERGEMIGACDPRGCEVEYEARGGVVVAHAIVWQTSVETRLVRCADGRAQARIPDHPERLAAAREVAALHGLTVEEGPSW